MDEQKYKMLMDTVADANKKIDEVKKEQKDHAGKTQKIEVTLAKVCESIDYHIRRTDLLEEMVEPMHEKRVKEDAVREFKKKQREEFMYKLKLPVAVGAALGAIAYIVKLIVGG